MAEHHQQLQHRTDGNRKLSPEKCPTTSQVLAVVALFPIGGILLTLAGVTLTGSVIGLVVTTPLFIIFSPVLVPAAFVIVLAVTGFLTSGALGLTALSSLSWIFNYLRGVRTKVPEHLDHAKRRMEEAAGHMGQRTKDLGQGMQSRAQEVGRKGG
ncbi:hypothetical protein HHK36_032598 [Tetracentron sinense]|uniref:Oleosin n=1 Tax=Tetracentron sinense TaxID=13715 RepID=A0A835D0A2_TETSI|nr:hypothetical protein HHK36_032598 [Tetracentron sinense]